MDDNRYWSVGNVVALVCFVSVALAPWLVVLARWPEIGPWELLGLATIWAVIGTFAAASTATWKKKGK